MVAIGAGASQTVAQGISEKGSFTLPCEVRWNSAVLPAGHYTFTIESTALPARMILRGANGSIFIQTMALSDHSTNQHSALTIERRGGTCFVKELYLSDRGRHFLYWEPSVPNNDRPLA